MLRHVFKAVFVSKVHLGIGCTLHGDDALPQIVHSAQAATCDCHKMRRAVTLVGCGAP